MVVGRRFRTGSSRSFRRPGAAASFWKNKLAAAALDPRVDDHRREDDGPRNRHLPERRDLHDRERVDDDAEKQRAEQSAGYRADAAGDRDPADYTGRDDRQFVTRRDFRIGDPIARHPQIAAETGDSSRDEIG